MREIINKNTFELCLDMLYMKDLHTLIFPEDLEDVNGN